MIGPVLFLVFVKGILAQNTEVTEVSVTSTGKNDLADSIVVESDDPTVYLNGGSGINQEIKPIQSPNPIDSNNNILGGLIKPFNIKDKLELLQNLNPVNLIKPFASKFQQFANSVPNRHPNDPGLLNPQFLFEKLHKKGVNFLAGVKGNLGLNHYGSNQNLNQNFNQNLNQNQFPFAYRNSRSLGSNVLKEKLDSYKDRKGFMHFIDPVSVAKKNGTYSFGFMTGFQQVKFVNSTGSSLNSTGSTSTTALSSTGSSGSLLNVTTVPLALVEDNGNIVDN